MKTKIIIIVCFALIFQGCIPSLHPLYTAKDLVLMKDIVGKWEESDEQEAWIFEKYLDKYSNTLLEIGAVPNPAKAYILTIKKGDEEEEFIAHFVKLGAYTYVDFYPVKDDDSMSGFFSSHLVAAHSFAKVKFEGSNLVFGMMDEGKLNEAIDENRVRVKHEMTNQGIVLTASTGELQKFITKYGDLEGSFDSETKLERSAPNAE